MAVTKSGSPIDLDYARKLVDNYQKTKIGATLPKEETRAVWFSKELILEALGLSPALDTKEISGLRMYFAAYQADAGYPANPSDNNKMTLVIVQTSQKQIEIDRGGVKEIAFQDIISDPAVQPSYPTGTPSPLVKTCYNEGQINPPPKSAAGLGLMDW